MGKYIANNERKDRFFRVFTPYFENFSALTLFIAISRLFSDF